MRCDGLVAEVKDWAAGLEEVHAGITGTFARVVVGWSIADHIRAGLVVDALERARWRGRPAPVAVVHSDCGSPYTSWIFGHRLRAAGLLAHWAGCLPASTTA